MADELDIIEEPVVEEPAIEAEAPEVAEAQGGEGGFNLDEWITEKQVKPEDLVKTWDTVTQKFQEASAKEKELEARFKPYQELEDSFKNDPAFQDYVLKYQQKDPSQETAEEKAARVEREFHDYVGSVKMGEVLNSLHQSVKGDGLPDFEDEVLVRYAADNRIADLEAAYMKMNKDAIRTTVRESTIAELKDTSKAKVETRTVGKAPSGPSSIDEQSQMSDADWLARFRKK